MARARARNKGGGHRVFIHLTHQRLRAPRAPFFISLARGRGAFFYQATRARAHARPKNRFCRPYFFSTRKTAAGKAQSSSPPPLPTHRTIIIGQTSTPPSPNCCRCTRTHTTRAPGGGRRVRLPHLLPPCILHSTAHTNFAATRRRARAASSPRSIFASIHTQTQQKKGTRSAGRPAARKEIIS